MPRSAQKPKPPPLPATTTDYVVQAQRGGNEARAALCQRIRERLDRFCLYLTGNRPQAQDLAQEAYLKVLEHLPSLEDPARFVPWLFRLTRNLFIDYVRATHRGASVAPYDLTTFLNGSSTDAALLAQVNEAMQELSASDRLLVLLVYLEEHSYDEAAALTGDSVEAVRSRLYRLRKRLKSDLFTRAE